MHLAFLFVFVLLVFFGGGGGVEGFARFFFTYIYILHLTQQCYNFFFSFHGLWTHTIDTLQH